MKLGYVLLYVEDVTATLSFYERAFGLARRFLHESGEYGEVETGATRLGFASHAVASSHGFSYRRTDPAENAPGFELAFLADDVAAAQTKALSAGAVLVTPPKTKPWGQTVAYVRDLNGFLVELCTPLP